MLGVVVGEDSLLWRVSSQLGSSATELQQNSNAFSREDYIPQILTVLLEIHCAYICGLLSFVCPS